MMRGDGNIDKPNIIIFNYSVGKNQKSKGKWKICGWKWWRIWRFTGKCCKSKNIWRLETTRSSVIFSRYDFILIKIYIRLFVRLFSIFTINIKWYIIFMTKRFEKIWKILRAKVFFIFIFLLNRNQKYANLFYQSLLFCQRSPTAEKVFAISSQ